MAGLPYARGWRTDPMTGGAAKDSDYDTGSSDTVRALPATEGKIASPSSYGGYKAVAHRNPDGSFNLNAESGQREAVAKYQGIGEAAGKRGAYRADYGDANEARTMATGARSGRYPGDSGVAGPGQAQAVMDLGSAARGDTPSAAGLMRQDATDSALRQYMQSQGGVRGASTSQGGQSMAALAAGGLANASNVGQYAAGEQAQAQQRYIDATGRMRGQDLASMGMAEQRAVTGLDAELAQRQLNQQREMGYEGLAYGVNQFGLNEYSSQREMQAGIYENAIRAREEERKRSRAFTGAMLSAGGAGIAAVSQMGRSGGSSPAQGDGGGAGSSPDYGYDGEIYTSNPYGDG